MKELVFSLLLLSSIQYSFCQDFWQPSNGPFGGAQVNDYLYYGDSTILLATSEGIIKSTDNGNSWNRNASVIKYFYSVSMDSFKVLYATASDAASNPYLYKSTDAGNNWIPINNNFWAEFRDVLITYKDTIIVGSWDNGLYRTFDRGISWENINNGLEYLHIYRTYLLSNGELLVGTSGSGVFRSSNFGNDWVGSNNGIPIGGNGYRYVYCIIEIFPGKILCGTQDGIYYSSDFGHNWVYKSSGYENKRALDIIKDHYNNVYVATNIGGGVYSSSDQGNTWNHIGLNYSIYTLGFDADSMLCAGGLSHGLNRYLPSGNNWSQIYNKGYTPVETNVLSLINNGSLVASTYLWGLFSTTDNGQNWKSINNIGPVKDLISIDDTTIVFYYNSIIYLSYDLGNTWQQIGNFSLTSMFYDSLTQKIYIGIYGEGDGPSVYSTSDFGQNWEFIHSFGPNCWGSWIYSIFVSKITGFIFVNTVCSDPRSGTYYFLYRSTDTCTTWDLVGQDMVFDITENSVGKMYGLSYSKLLISNDSGFTWSSTNLNASSLAIDKLDRIYYSYGGVIRASDGEAQNWTNVGNPLSAEINDIVISKNNFIYLATDEGVYFGDLNNFVLSIEDQQKSSLTFLLSQNYPNPFNPSTNIQYAISSRQFVTLKVYDVLGKEIATLVNEEKSPGSYETEFNASHLASGIYYYQLRTGDYVETKKMILLK
jgi:photosystem II stability/assembly factor-like uncharacterized protein